MTVVFDSIEVARLLRISARAMAYDINSSLEWKDETATVLGFAGQVSNRIVLTLWNTPHPLRNFAPHPYARGNEVVDVNLNKIGADTEDFFKIFCVNFTKALAQSPKQARQYLVEKNEQTKRCWANMTYKFESARKVQNEVLEVLTTAVDNTYRIKIGADIGMAIALEFAPVWIALPAGMLYTAATELAKTATELDRADIGVVKRTAEKPEARANVGWAGVGAVNQGYLDKAAEDGEKLAEHAEKMAEKFEVASKYKIGQIVKKAGGSLLNSGERKQILRQEGKMLAEKEAARLAKLTASNAKGFQWGFRVGGLAVSLVLMKDDIVKAFHGYTATEREELLKKGKVEK